MGDRRRRGGWFGWGGRREQWLRRGRGGMDVGRGVESERKQRSIQESETKNQHQHRVVSSTHRSRTRKAQETHLDGDSRVFCWKSVPKDRLDEQSADLEMNEQLERFRKVCSRESDELSLPRHTHANQLNIQRNPSRNMRERSGGGWEGK
jgi:hypothetical protein